MSRFQTEFQLVVDAFADHVSAEAGPDGLEAAIRLVELHSAIRFDPGARAYVVVASEDLEALAIEEAALEYTGLVNGSTVRAGRMFVDFGDQMSRHVSELRTLERPLVLREFLGVELAGTGVRFEQRHELDTATDLRWSLGVFATLVGESHVHGGIPGPVAVEPERSEFDELSVSCRIEVGRELGEHGDVRLGCSGRFLPEFSFVDDVNALRTDRLSNAVLGAHLLHARERGSNAQRLLVGGELLWFDGDLSAETDTSGPLPVMSVVHDRVAGGYLFAECGWNGRDSVGAQFSWIDSPEDPLLDERELDLYGARELSEHQRLRLGVTSVDSDLAGDSTRVYVQLTTVLGEHTH